VKEFEIYCPRCAWRPAAEDRWECTPGCGTIWNTFWTRGMCPGCGKQWGLTQCLACEQLSPHKHWYHAPQGGAAKDHEKADLTATQ
jgi:hypothetical protein